MLIKTPTFCGENPGTEFRDVLFATIHPEFGSELPWPITIPDADVVGVFWKRFANWPTKVHPLPKPDTVVTFMTLPEGMTESPPPPRTENAVIAPLETASTRNLGG